MPQSIILRKRASIFCSTGAIFCCSRPLSLWYSKKKKFHCEREKQQVHSDGKMNILLIIAVTLLMNVTIASGVCAADRSIGLPLLPDDVCPILPGQKIPAVTLKTIEGKPFDLAGSIAKNPTILIFYRGGW
jgi:hypothetical protein